MRLLYAGRKDGIRWSAIGWWRGVNSGAEKKLTSAVDENGMHVEGPAALDHGIPKHRCGGTNGKLYIFSSDRARESSDCIASRAHNRSQQYLLCSKGALTFDIMREKHQRF